MLFRAILISLAIASGAAASTTQPVSEIRRWVLQLGDPEPEVRDAARHQLLNLDPADLPALRAAVVDGAANLPGQADVLYDIVRQLFLSGRRPVDPNSGESFLGLRLLGGTATGEVTPGIAFQQRIIGFPAFAAFEEGDVLLSVEELPDSYLTDRAALAQLRKAIPAGVTVHFRVQRDNKIVFAEITLAATPPMESQSPDAVALALQEADDYWNRQFAGLLSGPNM